MKRILILLMVLALARFGWADATIIIYNVGTNMVSYGLSLGGPDAHSGTGNLLAGQTVTNTTGALGTNLWLNWGVPGSGNLQYNEMAGTIPTNAYPPNPVPSFGPLPIFANGHPTNCTDTFSIFNPSNQTLQYNIYRNGMIYGVCFVYGGATAVFNIPNPGCEPTSWTSQQVTTYTGMSTFGGPQQQIPSQTGGGYIAPGFSFDGGNQGGQNTLLSGTTTGGSGGSGGGGNVGVPPPPAPYTNNPNGANTNGPINYGTNNAANPTNTIINATVQQGDNALYTAIVQEGQNIVTAVNKADVDNQNGQGAISNLLTTVTNELGALSVITNQLAGSNGIDGYTNFINNITNQDWLNGQASSYAGGVSNTYGDAISSVPSTSFTPPSYDGSFWTIRTAVGADTYTFDMDVMGANAHGMDSIASMSYQIIYWAATGLYLVWLCGYCMKYLKSLPQVRQLSLPNLDVKALTFGGNLGAFAYPAYIAIMMGVLGVLPTILLNLIIHHSSILMSALGSAPWAGVAPVAMTAVAYANNLIPIAYLVSLVGLVVIDMLTVASAYNFAAIVIKSLAGG